ncbi:hypothetical protein BDB01DRAFT_56223 [Pilobolus umbonatus]|nr:hypothetical protein BDB01DRAFT_56223 [Pilobolus umbonatus]
MVVQAQKMNIQKYLEANATLIFLYFHTNITVFAHILVIQWHPLMGDPPYIDLIFMYHFTAYNVPHLINAPRTCTYIICC